VLFKRILGTCLTMFSLCLLLGHHEVNSFPLPHAFTIIYCFTTDPWGLEVGVEVGVVRVRSEERQEYLLFPLWSSASFEF
jgi:hypothetical protein